MEQLENNLEVIKKGKAPFNTKEQHFQKPSNFDILTYKNIQDNEKKRLERKLSVCHLPAEEQDIAQYINSTEYKWFSRQQKFQVLLFILSTNNNQLSKELYGLLITYGLLNNNDIQLEWNIHTSLQEENLKDLSIDTIKYISDNIIKDIWININSIEESQEKEYLIEKLWPNAQYLDQEKIKIQQSENIITIQCQSYFNDLLLWNLHNKNKDLIIKNKGFFDFCEDISLHILQQEWTKIKNMWQINWAEYINKVLEDEYQKKIGKRFTDYQKSHLKNIYGAVTWWSEVHIKNIKDYKIVTMRTGQISRIICDLTGKNFDNEYKQTLKHEIQHTIYTDILEKYIKKWTIKIPQMMQEKHLLYSTVNEILAHMWNRIDENWCIDFNSIKKNLISNKTWDYTRYFERDVKTLSEKIDEIISFIKQNYPEEHKNNNNFKPNQEAINIITQKCLSNQKLRLLETKWLQRMINTNLFHWIEEKIAA